MALAARLYAPYDKVFSNDCRQKALLSYRTLMDTGFVSHTQKPFVTGEYPGGDGDKRAWAAAELWETTGEPEYLEYLEGNFPVINSHITWGDVGTIAALTYLNSRRAGRSPAIVERARETLFRVADGLIQAAARHGYARNLDDSYYWGANGTVAGTAYILHSAYLHSGDPAYRHAVQDAAAWLLGRNYYGRSFVTGVGHNPPEHPHDRTSMAGNKPWPGRLIGGSHTKKDDGNAPPDIMKCAKEATCWFDVKEDYYTNEVAINWNAPLAFALAALMPEAGVYPAPYPGQPDDGVPVRYAAPAKKAAARAGITRAVKVRGGRLNVPAGAKVYGLDGRLIADMKGADSRMPVINRNGVFIIKSEL
jgi:endoglucanase